MKNEIQIIANTKRGTALSLDQWNLYYNDDSGLYDEPERISVSKGGFIYSLLFFDDDKHPTIEVHEANGDGDPENLVTIISPLEEEI